LQGLNVILKLTSDSVSNLIKLWNNTLNKGKTPGKYQSRSPLVENLKDNTYSFYLFFYAGQVLRSGINPDKLARRVNCHQVAQ